MNKTYININSTIFKVGHSEPFYEWRRNKPSGKFNRICKAERLVLLKRLQSSGDTAPIMFIGRVAEEDLVNEEGILTTKEVCSKYGISERTIRRWRKIGHLPYIRNNRTILFEATSVKQVLTQKRKQK